ncbi:MAG: Flp family type IVb pilin [Candidatus Eremiobacteraeota bacterium]|nr:Flp family type IVb pilin [Candidatus Eremiobacteraeota bacterium]
MNALTNLLNDDNGATLVEYGIIVALIAVASIAIIGTLGGQIKANFTTISSQL